jgi:hypothetical protein
MTSDMENREWLNDYEILKQVNTTNPFTVPNGYFDELNTHILSAVKLDELKNTISPDCFTVPDGYFKTLGEHIQSRIAVEEFLAEEHGFTVPENYFEDLNSNVQSRIAVEELLTEEHGFTVPENYFENLNTQIQSRLRIEQALINAEDTFTVPEDYFNRLNKDILNQTVNQEIVKRKNNVIRMFSSTAFKYATAACVILMVGAGVIFKPFNTTINHNDTFLHKQLSVVPSDDIQSYLQETVDGNDTQHAVSDEDLPVNDESLKSALQDYVNDNK